VTTETSPRLKVKKEQRGPPFGIVTIRGEQYIAMRRDLWRLQSAMIQALGGDHSIYRARADEYKRAQDEAESMWTLVETMKFFSATEVSVK
jgi:hypothetical protein